MENNITFTIALHKVADFKETLERLNKKLAKMGCDAVKTIAETEVMKAGNPYVAIEITRPFSTKINGWELAGKLFVDNTEQLIILSYKKSISLTAIKENRCDHCGINRKRLSTYVLVNEQGELKQVGAACLNSYIGLNILKVLERFDAFVTDTEKSIEETTETMKFPGYKVHDIIGASVISYFNHSKKWEKSVDGYGTASMVYNLILNAPNNSPVLKTDDEIINHRTLVSHIEADIFKGECFKDMANNFLSNIRVAFFHAGETLTRSTHHALIAWAVFDMLNKHSFGYGEPVKKVDLSNSQHLGKVGEKITLTLTVKSSATYLAPSFSYRSTESFSTLLTCYDTGYNWVSFFLQGSDRAKEGDVLTITGKVKEHTAYKGVKQTKLNYVKKVG